MFEAELAFFIAHQDELVRKFKDKTLVLRGGEIVGVYDSNLQAYCAAQEQFPAGSFMIQPCQPGPGAYTATINSLHPPR